MAGFWVRALPLPLPLPLPFPFPLPLPAVPSGDCSKPAPSTLQGLCSSIVGAGLSAQLDARGQSPTCFHSVLSLDAEVLLDTDSQLLPLRAFVAPHLALPSGSQPLPPGAKR